MSAHEEVQVSSNHAQNTPHNSAQILPVHFSFWLPDPFGTHCSSVIVLSSLDFSFLIKSAAILLDSEQYIAYSMGTGHQKYSAL